MIFQQKPGAFPWHLGDIGFETKLLDLAACLQRKVGSLSACVLCEMQASACSLTLSSSSQIVNKGPECHNSMCKIRGAEVQYSRSSPQHYQTQVSARFPQEGPPSAHVTPHWDVSKLGASFPAESSLEVNPKASEEDDVTFVMHCTLHCSVHVHLSAIQ